MSARSWSSQIGVSPSFSPEGDADSGARPSGARVLKFGEVAGGVAVSAVANCTGVDLGFRKALECRGSAFTGESISGRQNPGSTGAVPAQANWIANVASWVPIFWDLGWSESRASDLGEIGRLSVGPFVGVKSQLLAGKSGDHLDLMQSSGFSGILKNGSSGMVTNGEYELLIRSFRIDVQKGFKGRISSHSDRLWPLTGADPGRPVFVDRPVMPVRLDCPIGIASRDRVVQEGGVITQGHLVQIKGSNFAYGFQNTSETFEERASRGLWWRRCGDVPTGFGLMDCLAGDKSLWSGDGDAKS